MPVVVVVLFLCFSPSFVRAQNSATDSLSALLARSKPDTNRVQLFIQLSRSLYRRNPTQSGFYADSALALAERLRDKRGMAGALRMIGLLSYVQSDYGKALDYYNKAKRLFEELGDKQGIAGILNNIGALKRRKGELNAALELYQSALGIYERLQLFGDMGDVLINIGILQRTMGNYPEAIASYLRALRLFEQAGDKGGVASATMNAGNVYVDQQQYADAKTQYEYALRIFEEMADVKGVANCLLNIGRVAQLRKDYFQAQEYNLRALKLYEDLKDKSGMALCLNNLAFISNFKSEYAGAEEYYRRALKLNSDIGNEIDVIRNKAGLAQVLGARRKFKEADSLANLALSEAKSRNNKEMMRLCYETLFIIADSVGNYEQALAYYKNAQQWKDSLYNDESAKKIAQFRAQYEAEKKEQQIKLLENQKLLLETSKSLQAAELERQRLRQRENEQRIALLASENKLREREIERDRLEIERTNKEIALVRKEREAQDLKLRKRDAELRAEESARALLLGSIAAMALLGLVLINRFRLKQRSEAALIAANMKLEEANEEISRQMEIQAEQAREIELANTQLQIQNQIIKEEREELVRSNNLLDAAHAQSEALLLNILPAPIALRLKSGEHPIADKFESVTVLFADIAGFTKLSAQTTPEELVQSLSDVFERFDALARKHGLEKIKTIGDAYMVAGGLPENTQDHCERVARFALEIQSLLASEALRLSGGDSVKLRIGIHTGEAVAGVIGTSKFAYDLWGDTVNTASRMESNGVTGKIHCSQEVYLALKEKFVFEKRGEIEVKGKGLMHTWFLTGALDSAPDKP